MFGCVGAEGQEENPCLEDPMNLLGILRDMSDEEAGVGTFFVTFLLIAIAISVIDS